MKKTIASLLALTIALVVMSSLSLTASAADTYKVEFDFLDTTTYESFLVHNNGMKPAGDSRSYGYKGWLGSKNAEGATSVFVLDAGAGYVFQSLVIGYRGYSIAAGEPDSVRVYVSTTGETDYTAGYNDANWMLVAAIINDSTAGNGINVAEPTNRDPEVLRTADVTPYVLGAEKVYVRIDFFRGNNIDGVASTYFALANAEGDLLCVDPSLTAAPETEPETTAAPETQAPETEPETTKAPETEAPVATTEQPGDLVTPEATEAPVHTEAPAPDTEPAKDGGCGGMIAVGASILAIIGTALIIRKKD